jgi:hypothetical protein
MASPYRTAWVDHDRQIYIVKCLPYDHYSNLILEAAKNCKMQGYNAGNRAVLYTVQAG